MHTQALGARVRHPTRSLLIVMIIAGCGGARTAVAPQTRITDLRMERASLLAADSALAAAVSARGMLEALVPLLTDDAAYLQPGEPLLQGSANIRALLDRRGAAGALRFAWRPVRVDVSDDARLGYTFGYGRYAPVGGDGTPPSGRGGYLAVWRRAVDGEWRVAAFVRNNAQAELTTAPPGFESPSTAQPSVTTAPADIEPARAAIMRRDTEFSDHASKHGAAEAFAAFAAPDGALLNGAFGPDAIRASLARAPASGGTWRPVIAQVASTGELGYTVGIARSTSVVDGVTRTLHTKYLTVWKRQPTGEWLYVVDGGNSSPAP